LLAANVWQATGDDDFHGAVDGNVGDSGVAIDPAEEQAQLSSYGWINRDAGIAHIPIDRAMEIIVARGLPDVGGQQTPLQLMQWRGQQDRP